MSRATRDSAAARSLLARVDSRSTGKLTVGAGAAEIAVYLLDGEVVAATATDDDRQIVRMMMALGEIDEATAAKIGAQIDDGGDAFQSLINVGDALDGVLSERFRQNLADYLGSVSAPRFLDQRAVFVTNIQMGHDTRKLVDELCLQCDVARAIDTEITVVRGRADPGVDPRRRKIAESVGQAPRPLSSVLDELPMEPLRARVLVGELLVMGVITQAVSASAQTEVDVVFEPSEEAESPYLDEETLSSTPMPSTPMPSTPMPSTPMPSTPMPNASADLDDPALLDTVAPAPTSGAASRSAAPWPPVDHDPLDDILDRAPQSQPPPPPPPEITRSLDPGVLDPGVLDANALDPALDAMQAAEVTRSLDTDPILQRQERGGRGRSAGGSGRAQLGGRLAPPEPADPPESRAPRLSRIAGPVDDPDDEDIDDDRTEQVDPEVYARQSRGTRSLADWLNRTEETTEEEDLSIWDDHDRVRGDGKGQFGTNHYHRDKVEVTAIDDEGEILEADEAPVNTYSAPVLSRGDALAKIGVLNEALEVVSAAFDDAEGPGRGRAVIQLLVDGVPSRFAALLHDLIVEDTGELNPERLLGNLNGRPASEHRQLLNNSLMDLIERALSAAADELPDEAFDEVLAAIGGYRQRLGL